MNPTQETTNDTLTTLLLQQNALQQQLIETQRQLIETQKQLVAAQKKMDKMTPKMPRSKDVFWHIASGGMMSEEAANSDDLATVRKFSNWIVAFAEKHIKPYVHQKVFIECSHQMLRGTAERIAELQTEIDLTTPPPRRLLAPPSDEATKQLAAWFVAR